MKKLLLILMLAISTTLIAQPTFIRGYRIHLGYNGKYGDTEWQEGVPCNALIKLENQVVTIYAESTFQYHISKMIYNHEKQAKWSALSSSGEWVYIYIGWSDIEENSYLIVESKNTSVCIYTFEEN